MRREFGEAELRAFLEREHLNILARVRRRFRRLRFRGTNYSTEVLALEAVQNVALRVLEKYEAGAIRNLAGAEAALNTALDTERKQLTRREMKEKKTSADPDDKGVSSVEKAAFQKLLAWLDDGPQVARLVANLRRKDSKLTDHQRRALALLLCDPDPVTAIEEFTGKGRRAAQLLLQRAAHSYMQEFGCFVSGTVILAALLSERSAEAARRYLDGGLTDVSRTALQQLALPPTAAQNSLWPQLAVPSTLAFFGAVIVALVAVGGYPLFCSDVSTPDPRNAESSASDAKPDPPKSTSTPDDRIRSSGSMSDSLSLANARRLDPCAAYGPLAGQVAECRDGDNAACSCVSSQFRLGFGVDRPRNVELSSFKMTQNCLGSCGPLGITFCTPPQLTAAFGNRFMCVPQIDEDGRCEMDMVSLPCIDGTTCVPGSDPNLGICRPTPDLVSREPVPDLGESSALLLDPANDCPGPCAVGTTWCGDAVLDGKPFDNRWYCLAVFEHDVCTAKAVPLPCEGGGECLIDQDSAAFAVCSGGSIPKPEPPPPANHSGLLVALSPIPDGQPAGMPLTINVTVIDRNHEGIGSVVVIYQTPDNQLKSASLRQILSNLWAADIPGEAIAEPEFKYMVGTRTAAPNAPEETEHHKFTVVPAAMSDYLDKTWPEIDCDKRYRGGVAAAKPGQPLVLRVNVSDPSGVASIAATYAPYRGKGTPTEMHRLEGTTVSEVWELTIPASGVTSPHLFYSLTATDGAKNKNSVTASCEVQVQDEPGL